MDKPRLTVLEDSLLHQTMLFLHRPATWPLPAIAVTYLLLILPVSLIWVAFTNRTIAAQVALILGGVGLLDGILLSSLPRLRLSYGEWPVHLLLLGGCRIVIAGILSLVTLISTPWAIGLVMVAQIAGIILLIWGTVVEPRYLQLTSLQIDTQHFDKPLRLLHITDLHIERLTKREDQLLRFLAETQPDLIVITGDYLNLSYVEDETAQQEAKKLLRQLKAPYGVYATLGTPQLDIREWMPAFFADLPIRLLQDEVTQVDVGHGRQLTLIGMNGNHDLQHDPKMLAKLMKETTATQPRLLLYHSPELMPQAIDHKIDLYLCGHTHGGQVRLPFYGAMITASHLGKQYEMSHYQQEQTHLYVSRGIGFEGYSAPRIRFFCPPETTLVTLT